jgi:hypothetical protein
MPFGLANAPAIWQHTMQTIFGDMLNRELRTWMDHFLIYLGLKKNKTTYSWRCLADYIQATLPLFLTNKNGILSKFNFFDTSYLRND